MVGSTFLLICRIKHGDATHIPPHIRKPADKTKVVWRLIHDISVTTNNSIAANFYSGDSSGCNLQPSSFVALTMGAIASIPENYEASQDGTSLQKRRNG
jgi:hypothetical protein